MADFRALGALSNLVRFTLKHATTGQGLPGLLFSSTGLIISTITGNEETATTYTAAGNTIETITTLGTYAPPTATKCRFKEVDATNHKGLYEVQLPDARFAVSGAKKLIISITGAANLLDADYEVDFTMYEFLRAIMRNDVTPPAEVGGTYDDATDSLQGLEENMPFVIV